MKLLSVLCAASLCLAALVAPTKSDAEPAAYMVFELESGQVIAQKDAFRPWYPASVTKLMTAYVTFRALRKGDIGLQSAVVVSPNALSEPPSKMGFPVGTRITIDNALKMVIVKSANDIAVALGEAVSGTEGAFLQEMNLQARRLGMSKSHFNNPHGLPDDGHVSSVRDMAILSSALLKEFPEFHYLFKIASISIGKKRLKSANKLIERYPGAMGLKTGYICNSGLNMVAAAKRDGRTMIAVVFGAASGMGRAVTAAGLLDKAFARAGVLQSNDRLATLVAPSNPGQLPAQGYCRRAKKPTVEALLLKHGAKIEASAAYASAGQSTQELLRKALDPNAKPAKKTKKRKRKKKNGLNAGHVLDLLVGPRTVQHPVQVFLGAPLVSIATGKPPVPKFKPTVVAALGAATDPAATGQQGAPATRAQATQTPVRQIGTGTQTAAATPASAEPPGAPVAAEGGADTKIEPIDIPAPEELEQVTEVAVIAWPKEIGGVVIPQPRPAR